MLNVNIREIRLKNQESRRVILNNLSFYLAPGNIYTITGKNGSGKTTLLKSLGRLLDERYYDVAGEVSFNGTDLMKISPDALNDIRKKDIKYVLQDSMSAYNPLKKLSYYFRILNPDPGTFDKLLKFFLLPDRNILEKLHSYELSGGMAQRLSLVLALSAKPQLLLLDEVTSGVDYPISNLISGALKSFIKEDKAAVLLITQDITFAEHVSDYIGFIDKGNFSGFYIREEFFNSNSDINFAGLVEAYKKL